MNKLYFDIETLPAEEKAHGILNILYLKRESKKKETAEKTEFVQFVNDTSFDGAFGRVLCISYALNDAPPQSICNPDDEAKTLKKFWDVAAEADLFIGHNVRDFDLPFIIQRSRILGVRPSWNLLEEPGKKPWEINKFLSFARYKNYPIFDTMHEWNHWREGRLNKGLEHLAMAMNIPTPKEGIDGGQVSAFFKAGKIKEICDYCIRDVETVRAVYKRMTFEISPEDKAPF